MWAVCVYLEAIAVLLQLTMMQKTKMIEPSTAHYVFALGFARFLGSAAWIIQVKVFVYNRYHLRIHSNTSSQKLSVIDLSLVYEWHKMVSRIRHSFGIHHDANV
ncbi:putative ER lumen protein retaining receptor [Helianthus annuus]|nr:putative ER lumen protein retaining receptor [Helianthus annuus]